MPETQTADEVTSNRNNTRGGLAARPVEDDAVHASTGFSKTTRTGVEEDTHVFGRSGRAIKESTQKLLEKFESGDDGERAPAPHEEGDADEDEAAGANDPADGAEAVVDGGDTDEGGDQSGDAAEATAADETAAPDEWQTKAQTLEQRNRELVAELETAKRTPKAQRTERESALVAAEAAYIDEGSIPALRKFLGVITGSAPDSKEVDAELAGVFADLTARELGVPLDDNQRQLRDNARTRLLLARDKREKADADKKPPVDNSVEVGYGEAAKYVDNLLATKGQSGTSLADEYPMLMNLAQDFDGYAPSEVLARAIRQEIMTGTLDPTKTSDADMIRAVAPKIEKHYDAVAKRIEAARAKQKKPSTTTPSEQPKVANDASKEPRQSPGARTMTNAAASRAPATPPKTTKPKPKTSSAAKTRKDFQTEQAWKDYLLNKHFES